MRTLALRIDWRAPVLATSLLLATSAGAAAGEHREHGAHEHGVAQLNLVLEGEKLLIELASPGVNIVGFEHAPGATRIDL